MVVAAVVGVVLLKAKASNVDENMFAELLSMFKKLFFLHYQMTTFEFIITKGSVSSYNKKQLF